jgi:hypothetical protein
MQCTGFAWIREKIRLLLTAAPPFTSPGAHVRCDDTHRDPGYRDFHPRIFVTGKPNNFKFTALTVAIPVGFPRTPVSFRRSDFVFGITVRTHCIFFSSVPRATIITTTNRGRV